MRCAAAGKCGSPENTTLELLIWKSISLATTTFIFLTASQDSLV